MSQLVTITHDIEMLGSPFKLKKDRVYSAEPATNQPDWESKRLVFVNSILLSLDDDCIASIEEVPEPDEFTLAYLECAIWSSHDWSLCGDDDPDAPSNPVPMYENYSVSDIADDSLAQMIADCISFQRIYGIPGYDDPRYSDDEKAGHDFWLTRNGHGAGFWGRSELSKEDQDKYTSAAKSFGECDLCVGDDGKVHTS